MHTRSWLGQVCLPTASGKKAQTSHDVLNKLDEDATRKLEMPRGYHLPLIVLHVVPAYFMLQVQAESHEDGKDTCQIDTRNGTI